MNTRVLLYTRCRNDHWFNGRACPIDGYSDDFIRSAVDAENALRLTGDALTLRAIAERGAIDETRYVG